MLESQRILVIDGRSGIYLPEIFAKLYRDTAGRIVEGFDCQTDNEADLEDLLEGPDSPHYWEAWESLLNNIAVWRLADLDDEENWLLTQDEGDLFLENITEGAHNDPA